MINYDNFRLSLKNLEERYQDHIDPDLALPEHIRDAVAESTIQRFEICYDCLWKVLRRYLIEIAGIVSPPNSPKAVFRIAHENELLSSVLEQWFGYVNARIATSHDYDGEKAEACLALVPNFLDDAIGLYQTMTGETWE